MRWINILDKIITTATKSIIGKCYECKKHCTLSYPRPRPSEFNLPLKKTKLSMPFKTIDKDYACLIYYWAKSGKESKVQIFMFPCSVSRAVLLEVTRNYATKELNKCFKILITWEGIFYSLRWCKNVSDCSNMIKADSKGWQATRISN